AVDTPLGQLRSRIPGFGIGTIALGIFTFAFLPEIKADSAADFGNTPAYLASGETLTQSNGASITDAGEPALSHSQTASVSIGGPGAENFVFAPGIGADTIVNFNPQQDSIEFDHFADVQSIQELQSLITNDGHGDAVIDLCTNKY